jgi:hypothetical protein
MPSNITFHASTPLNETNTTIELLNQITRLNVFNHYNFLNQALDLSIEISSFHVRECHMGRQHVVKLSMFLDDLMSINPSDCSKLTQSALFSLVSNCSSLSMIKMERTSFGKMSVENFNSFVDFVVSTQLKCLYLTSNIWLRDESIKLFASIFPNLQLLDLSYCYDISGICQVLRRCRNIRHLNLAGCSSVKLRGVIFDHYYRNDISHQWKLTFHIGS